MAQKIAVEKEKKTRDVTKVTKGKMTLEKLSHFLCGACFKWWSVADIPEDKKDWHCPWCGTKQSFLFIKGAE